MVKERKPRTQSHINIRYNFKTNSIRKSYFFSLVSFDSDANVMFSFALKPNFLMNSIFSADNGSLAVPVVDC